MDEGWLVEVNLGWYDLFSSCLHPLVITDLIQAFYVLQAKEALEKKQYWAVDQEKGMIATYKESDGFRCGLRQSGQVAYEYGYHITVGCFKPKYLKMKVEEDPFTKQPEDADLPMAIQAPFNDSLDSPP
ncbi:hypothetical protein GW17_00051217 [Ensete ventricosum]|nr:hypothetical protein GW17_00051217 [Ensete ventricosum]